MGNAGELRVLRDAGWRSCACAACQLMCMRPCWPTPDEAARLIDAGLAGQLMLDSWLGASGELIWVVCPAVRGFERGDAPSDNHIFGGCVMFNDAGLCGLHARGMKPAEGRLSHHDHEWDGAVLHEAVARTWDGDDGAAVRARFCAAVGLENPEAY